MTRPHVPSEILDLAHQRRSARDARDFALADELRAAIEAGGWTVVDRGVDFDLRPLRPPDVVADGVVRYGSSSSVPSRLDETATVPASVIIVATEWPDDIARAVRALRADGPDATQIVVVADGATPDEEPPLAALTEDGVEVVRTAQRLGQAAAINAGVRRTTGAMVILLDGSVEATGDLVAPLAAALRDPGVGVTGGWGIVSEDLRHFEAAHTGDVDAIEGYCLAFRRVDFIERGPLDERFVFYRNLDIWWSLVLRDEGEEAPPRRATSVALPAIRHEHRGWTSLPDEKRDRLSKRNFYRVLDRFGARHDLLIATSTASGSSRPHRP
ncbi:MAG TPA: glycosyltransferase [Candidatus Limnocylindrales bacterium]